MGAAMTWPSFSFPLGAWFFLAIGPLIILYFLKLKRPRLEIPSLALWQSVVNDQRVNSPFQKFRRNLLLLLQLILLCLIILALMQPFISAGPASAEFLPVLIDCSASMSSTVEGSDQTRLELAKERAAELIDELGGQGKIALFTFASNGRRLTEFTDNKNILNNALERIQATHRASKLDEVLRMAEAYGRTSLVERVVILTDGNVNDRVEFELPFALDIRKVDEGGNNLGITEMNARRSGPESWDVFVRVGGSSSDAIPADLTLIQDGKVVGRETIVASKQDSERVVFPIDTTEASLLEARLEPSEFDSLDLDNSVWLNLPRPRPLRVWASQKLFSWQHAMNVQADIEMDVGDDPSAPEYDLIISDSTDLKSADAPIIVYIGIIPTDLQNLIRISEVNVDTTPVEIVDWAQTAPLLQHVRLRDVQIGEKTEFADGITSQQLEERGYEVLIHGKDGPLMLQKRRGLETEFYFLFHTDRSTLPYRVAFPILVTNVIEAALQRASMSEVAASPTGVLPAIGVEANRDDSVVAGDGTTSKVRSTASGLLTGIQGETVSRYDIMDGTDVVASVGTGLLSPLETSLNQVEELQFSELLVKTNETEIIDSDRDLWWPLALLAFGFLLLEWWYFQRARGAAV
jgi:Ca-activated chloride channel family protein